MTTLSWKQLNRSVLARQLLLERHRLPLHRVVERMDGVQVQYIPSAYIGLWSRMEGFSRDLLIRRYLAGFGPASRDDIRTFTGLGLAAIDTVLGTLRVREFSDEQGDLMFDVHGGQILDGDTPAPVRFLGSWDACLLVHARRTLILTGEHRDRIFHTRAPHSFNTFLVDGQVRGTWKEGGGKILLDRFQPIPRRFHRDLDDEMARLAKLFE